MEIDQSAKTGKELGLLMADIDFFKRVNDTHGHLIGDKVLRITGAMLKNCVKGRDLVARYGGDEFVIMLPDTPGEGAITVAENIRSYFEAKRWKKKETGQPIGTITLSLGVSLYSPGGTH